MQQTEKEASMKEKTSKKDPSLKKGELTVRQPWPMMGNDRQILIVNKWGIFMSKMCVSIP